MSLEAIGASIETIKEDKDMDKDSFRYMELLRIAEKTGQVLTHQDRQSLLLSIVRTTTSPSLRQAGKKWEKLLGIGYSNTPYKF